MKRFIALIMLSFSVLLGNSVIKAVTITMSGTIGSYPAIVEITMNEPNKIKGYYKFTGSSAPQSGKISISGTYKHIPDPDMPHYPYYKAVLNATSGGKNCGKWNVEIDTRSGFLNGTCTINGKKYNVSVEEQY